MPDAPASELTALDMLRNGLQQAATAPLIEYRGAWVTGAAFQAGAEAFAGQMQAAGLGEGDCALIIVTDNLSAMQGLLGAWMLGASTFLVDFRTTPDRFVEWQNRILPKVVVSSRELAAAAALHPLVLRADRPVPAHFSILAEDRVADHVSTSGSTGLPRLTPAMQKRLGLRIRQMMDNGERGAWGRAVSALSVAYPASRAIWLRNLAAAKPIVALDLVHKLSELDAALRRADVEECTLPPSVIRRLAHQSATEGPRYPHLKKLQSVGGPAVPEDKILALRRLTPNYCMTYSSTECGVITRISGAEILDRPASCGRAVAGMHIAIKDGDRLCPPGEPGIIVATRADGPTAQPGDIGWLDDAGYLFVTGRVSGLLCRNGVNFSAERLSNAALLSPETVDAAVIAIPAKDGGDEAHLFVECRADAEAAIAAALHQRLSAAEMPDRLHFGRSLPRSASGKVDLPKLRTDLLHGLERRRPHEQ
jgi:acyl-coenzyme A synthetase/AMP-(fatty) acid ligase